MCRSTMLIVVLNAIVTMFTCRPAHAGPDISGELVIDGQVRLNKDRATDTVANQLFLDGTALEVEVVFTPAISLFANTVFEQVGDFADRDDVYLDSHGAFVQELLLRYEKDHFAAFGGKYNVSFGRAWDITPGVYRKVFASEYEFTERIGFGAEWSSGKTDYGVHTVSFGAGFVDTSILSDSIFAHRGRTTVEQGGPGNTERFDSYNLTVDGEDAAGVTGLNYHIAYIHQSRRSEAERDLNGYTVAVHHSREVGWLTLSGMIEWTELRTLEAGLGTTTFLTPAAEVLFGAVSVAVIYSKRESSDLPGEELLEMSVGYAFDSGLQLNLSWAGLDSGNDPFHSIGARFVYSHRF